VPKIIVIDEVLTKMLQK